MCLKMRSCQQQPFIAKRDITVYKLLRVMGETLLSPYFTGQGPAWKLGQTYSISGHEWQSTVKEAKRCSYLFYGFHSHSGRDKPTQRDPEAGVCWYEAVIPEGAQYYRSHPAEGELISNQLRLVKVMP